MHQPGKAKRVGYGIVFFWFVAAMIVMGMIVAAIGATRDAWEDRHE
jgi:hypothetical protein